MMHAMDVLLFVGAYLSKLLPKIHITLV